LWGRFLSHAFENLKNFAYHSPALANIGGKCNKIFAPSAEHFANGYLNESTMLWAEGRSEWMLLSSIPELHTAVAAKDRSEQG
jgi:hypothetical protein